MHHRQVTTIADQAANLSLKLMAGVNVMFLIAFLLLMAFAGERAQGTFAPHVVNLPVAR